MMKSVAACKTLALATCMSISSLASAYATDKPPTIVRDPVLGLKYSIAAAKFEAAPAKLFHICADAVNENAGRQSWIFAKLATPAGTYYVLGGYYVRNQPEPPRTHKYESDDAGMLLRVAGEHCEVIDPANESFGDASALPPEILEPLAADLRRRLQNGFGGRTRLGAAMRAQKVDLSSFAPAARRGFGQP